MSAHPEACLPITGERTVPGVDEENYWFRRHEACYQWAAVHLPEPPGRILEAGCGEGYGAASLAESRGACVVAVELDGATATHAHRRYGSAMPELSVLRANLVALPFASSTFQAAVSLQVIEHMWDVASYLQELARCTSGPIIVSTPNRPVASPGLSRGELPRNPFHVREFDAAELVELLVDADPSRQPRLFGVHHRRRIRQWESDHGSLPEALLGGDPRAAAFARDITARDFQITELAGHDTAEPHDLLAIW